MTYTRNRTIYLPYSRYQYTGPVPFQESTFRGVVLLNRILLGTANPRWKTQIRNGQNAGTNMSADDQLLELHSGSAVSIQEKGSLNPNPPPYFTELEHKVSGNIIIPGSFPSGAQISETTADNQALSRLYAALRQQRSHTQAGVTAGELPKTIEEIRHFTQQIANRFASHRRAQARYLGQWLGTFRVDSRGNPVRTRELVDRSRRLPPSFYDILRDQWLSFSLGIRPLVKDVKDLAETVARWKHEHERVPPMRIRGYGRDQKEHYATTSLGIINTINYVLNERSYSTVEVIWRCGLRPDMNSASFGSAHRLFQLLGSYDLENWVPTIWNLLPWSFVVDYVTNVADVVTAMITDTSQVSWVLKTTRYETVKEVGGNVPYQREYSGNIDGPVYRTQSGTLGGYKQTTRKVVRTVQSGIALPTLSFNLPSTEGFAIPNLIALFSGGSHARHS